MLQYSMAPCLDLFLGTMTKRLDKAKRRDDVGLEILFLVLLKIKQASKQHHTGTYITHHVPLRRIENSERGPTTLLSVVPMPPFLRGSDRESP
jgi:hypothetical protein